MEASKPGRLYAFFGAKTAAALLIQLNVGPLIVRFHLTSWPRPKRQQSASEFDLRQCCLDGFAVAFFSLDILGNVYPAVCHEPPRPQWHPTVGVFSHPSPAKSGRGTGQNVPSMTLRKIKRPPRGGLSEIRCSLMNAAYANPFLRRRCPRRPSPASAVPNSRAAGGSGI